MRVGSRRKRNDKIADGEGRSAGEYLCRWELLQLLPPLAEIGAVDALASINSSQSSA